MTQTANWYHCSVKPVSRSAGRSAVAAAAYRTGERLHDEQTQLTHDYTRRHGVEAAFIVAPAGAPEWANDTGKLWNAAEAAENRKNSRVAREVELALPSGVSAKEREAIARELALHLVERYGVAVGVALHKPSPHGDDRNHHAHILFTTRRMNAEGLGEKTRELDDKKTGAGEISHIREYACELINAALERAGSDERIDHRSFKERGIDQLPTEHLSREALAMERAGKESDAGDRNRATEQANDRIEALQAEREELDKQIAQAQQPQESQAGENGTYWQDRINAEKEQPEEPPADTPTAEETRTAQSAFADPVMIAATEQITEQGEVKLSGFASLVEYATELAEWTKDLKHDINELAKELKEDVTNITHKVINVISDKWQNLVSRNRDDLDLDR